MDKVVASDGQRIPIAMMAMTFISGRAIFSPVAKARRGHAWYAGC